MPKFDLGQAVATPGALDLLARLGVRPAVLLARHASGDWGDVSIEDSRSNESAVADGDRILSAYQIGDERVWILTEAVGDDGRRAATTILLPDEY